MPPSKKGKQHASNSRISDEDYDLEWFQQNGHRAGSILRKCHAMTGTRRMDFVFGLEDYLNDNEEPSEEHMDALIQGGIVQVLFDIALERQLYSNYYVDDTYVSS